MVSEYKDYTEQQLGELFSNFLVSSWSYSKVASFARNEKAFEMAHIYGIKGKSSATTVAGQAYHFALDRYFNSLKSGEYTIDLAMLETLAFDYIEDYRVQFWKLQKTTPTVEECKIKAVKSVTSLLNSFFGELSTYLEEIDEVLDVEVYCDEFLVLNGVSIPLPCHARIDTVFRTKKKKVVIVDHKSKTAFSDPEEMKLAIGNQAITYVKCYEAKSGLKVDEVWFIENKIAKNKDGSRQLNKYKVEITPDTRRLYEALLYEPLKRMISAVNDPDYIYIINEADNYVDKGEIYEFWAKTMIAEVEDFPVDPAKKELISKRLKKIRDASLGSINPKIIKQFQQHAAEFIHYDLSNKNMSQQEQIEHVLRTFGILTSVAHKFDGYSSNTYLLEMSAGTKIASVSGHRLDIANVLNVETVRIAKELTVYQGKSYLPVEFSKVREKDLMFEPQDLSGYKIPMGRDNFGNVVVWDLENHSTPHVLTCGATGSGKSVWARSTIEYAKLAKVDEIIILDPKFEFADYAEDGRVKVFNEILDIENEMIRLVALMNEMVKNKQHRKIMIVFDEFADAVAQGRQGKELDIVEMVKVGEYAPRKGPFGMMLRGEDKMALKKTGEIKSLEENLRILLQKGRSSGFRIIAATQRASTKVITGDAKVNFPVQVCFRVPKETDSRVVLDEAGAESLQGRGDGLFKSPQYKDTVRFQAYYKG